MLSRKTSSDEELLERGMGFLLIPLLAAVGEDEGRGVRAIEI